MINKYFDNAATSYPKPSTVYKSVINAMLNAGGNPGRSAHTLSKNASAIIYDTRELIGELFDYPHPERIIFTPSATFALNTAIFSLRCNGGTFLISDMEHNATLRPIVKKASLAGAAIRVFRTYDDKESTVSSFLSTVPQDCCAVIINAASNVNGRVLPINEIGKICKKAGIPYIVDASQLAGHEKISFTKTCADFLCCAAHKGFYSPMGCGFMLISEAFSRSEPLVYGGNGIDSLSYEMGDELPERFEAGTVSVPLIAGLKAGAEFLQKIGFSEIQESGRYQKQIIEKALSECEGYSIFSSESCVPVISVTHKKLDCERVSEALATKGFSTRGGLHCAPLAHKALGTVDSGTVRISPGYFNTKQDIDKLIEALRAI